MLSDYNEDHSLFLPKVNKEANSDRCGFFISRENPGEEKRCPSWIIEENNEKEQQGYTMLEGKRRKLSFLNCPQKQSARSQSA